MASDREQPPRQVLAELSAAAGKTLVPAWTSGDATTVRPALETVLAEFRKKELPPKDYLRSGVTIEQLLLWLYDLEHIRLSYGLKYNGVELEKLSPGTKGIVLLILYLGMDVGDTCPLTAAQQLDVQVILWPQNW